MKNKRIGIIKTGNSGSVSSALEMLGFYCFISDNPEKLSKSDALILPGVGSFGQAMKSLSRLRNLILNWKKPFLGICLGMQVLFEKSEESSGVKGFGIIKGEVKKFQNIRVPQIGWNRITNLSGPLFSDKGYVYFVNSYFCVPNESVKTSTTNYVVEFASSVQKNNFYGVQFHPEKSGEYGLKILERFARLLE